MNFSLTPELEKFIQRELRSGYYRSASEVVRAGLRMLKDRQPPQMPELPATRRELEAELLAAVQSLEVGEEGKSGKQSLRQFRTWMKQSANG